MHKTTFTDEFKRIITKIKKKDKLLFHRLHQKIRQIVKQPNHYKPLKNFLKSYRACHVDPFVILFKFKNDEIIFDSIKHHDKAYTQKT